MGVHNLIMGVHKTRGWSGLRREEALVNSGLKKEINQFGVQRSSLLFFPQDVKGAFQ